MKIKLWTVEEAKKFLKAAPKSSNPLPEDVAEAATIELQTMERAEDGSPEHRTAQIKFDWLVNLPWTKERELVDLNRVHQTFEALIFAQDRAKNQLAAHFVSPPIGLARPIFYFLGVPGTGKTRLAEAVSVALNRPMVKIRPESVAGETELGQPQEPSEIANILRTCGLNAVVLIEDADRMMKDCPILSVMAAYQEGTPYEDKYLGVALDLSNLIIIATGRVPPDFLNWLPSHVETVEMHGYTMEEKLQIAKEHIIEDSCMWMGFKKKVNFTDESIAFLALHYAREGGVKALREVIGSVLRRIRLRTITGEKVKKVTSTEIVNMIGPPPYQIDEPPVGGIGKVNGLAWTECGGDLLPVTCAAVEVGPGKGGNLILTGNLGHVMKESAQVALTYLKAHGDEVGVSSDLLWSHELHLHIQDGATPKDGPSAGLSTCIAMVSALLKKPVRCDFAVTGEIDLFGKACAVGGLHEKIEGALRCGVSRVFLPRANAPEAFNLRGSLATHAEIRMIDSVAELLLFALGRRKRIGELVARRPRSNGRRKKAGKRTKRPGRRKSKKS